MRTKTLIQLLRRKVQTKFNSEEVNFIRVPVNDNMVIQKLFFITILQFS